MPVNHSLPPTVKWDMPLGKPELGSDLKNLLNKADVGKAIASRIKRGPKPPKDIPPKEEPKKPKPPSNPPSNVGATVRPPARLPVKPLSASATPESASQTVRVGGRAALSGRQFSPQEVRVTPTNPTPTRASEQAAPPTVRASAQQLVPKKDKKSTTPQRPPTIPAGPARPGSGRPKGRPASGGRTRTQTRASSSSLAVRL